MAWCERACHVWEMVSGPEAWTIDRPDEYDNKWSRLKQKACCSQTLKDLDFVAKGSFWKGSRESLLWLLLASLSFTWKRWDQVRIGWFSSSDRGKWRKTREAPSGSSVDWWVGVAVMAELTRCLYPFCLSSLRRLGWGFSEDGNVRVQNGERNCRDLWDLV